MAGATSFSSCSSEESYDVFLSFRGEDTRRIFVSHLYAALIRKNIKTYQDMIDLEKGYEVGPALLQAIENSSLCIVVFSKNYASSTWCLRELTHILDRKQKGEIIPVFYEMDPSHVRKQSGSYKDAFEKHEKDSTLDEETVSKWKASLKKAANFAGLYSENYRTAYDFIEEVVEEVLRKLRCKYWPSESSGLINLQDMAGAASCLPSSSSENYDVFLSYRGKDTGRSFIAHLYKALCTKGIKTYKDDIDLEKGDKVGPALFQAIDNSSSCVVVLSRGYAASTWCLRELTYILKWKKVMEVLPVFYEIDASHVRKQTGSYRDAFVKYEEESKHGEETIQNWKAALAKITYFPGFDSAQYGNDVQLIGNIVEGVCQILKSIYPSSIEPKGLVGTNKSIADMEKLLRDFQSIGLWGIAGIGKTTIAEALFQKYSNSSQYSGHCFLKDISKNSSKLKILREQLLKELFKGENIHIDMESDFVKSKLNSETAFIVLDDVDASEQIDYLMQGIGLSSRIIITTRDRKVLSGRVDKIYAVRGLDFQESLQLFSLSAFKTEHPPMEFRELSKQVVNYAQGLPLVLKLLGSHLRGKSTMKWERSLTNLKRGPYKPIDNMLKLSYDGLQDEHKKIFLDIAFFFRGKAKDDVERFLNVCGFHAIDGLEVLEDKALVTISNEGKVEMHDLIQQMGWKRVHEVCEEDPGRRSRLRNPEEIHDVLKNNTGSDLIEGIMLDMSAIGDLHINADSFKKMVNLRFLKFYSPLYSELSNEVYISSHVELISHKLSYFQWDAWPLQSLPSTFCPEKLVELRMPNSHVEKLWDGVQDTVNLRIIDLRGSKSLINLPSLSNSLNLEEINLSYCENLHCVDLSISRLPKLVYLDLSGCLKLECLVSMTLLKSLKELKVKGCSSLKEFSLSSKKIRELRLSETTIEILPSSIGRCSRLKCLYLPDSLRNLPNELSNLRSLQKLVLGKCRELDTGNFHIILDGLQSLEELDLSGCFNLSDFPRSLGSLSRLEILRLDGSCVESLPTSITHLSLLRTLSLQNCSRLRHLPKLPPAIQLLKANNCTSLETVSTLKEPEVTSCQMDFLNCVKLDQDSLFCVQEFLGFIIKQREVSEFHVFSHRIEACFPGYKIPMCFLFRGTERRMIIGIPCSDLKGFAFCVIISPDIMPPDSDGFLISCECHFVNGETVKYQYIPKPDPNEVYFDPSIGLISEHVCVWYENYYFVGRLNRTEEKASNQCTNFNQKVFIEFSSHVTTGTKTMKMNWMIKECGVWPILNKK